MRMQTRTTAVLALVSVFLVGLLVTGLALAAPGAQSDILPTPTAFPVGELDYTLSAVGGADETLTFKHDDVDGFTFGTTTVRSFFPDGLFFTVAPESPNGAIEDVILFVRFSNESNARGIAEWNPETELWEVMLRDLSGSDPPWINLDWYWRVRDETGASVETAEEVVDYWDPNRRWFRVETPHYIVYWWGFLENDPDAFAQLMARSINSTHQRRLDGFGSDISYRPVAVVYPSHDDALADGLQTFVRRNVLGYNDSTLGMTIQVVPVLTEQEIVELATSTLLHELVHQWQFDVIGGNRGPQWWTEGQAEWFTLQPRRYDERLFNLVQLQDLPSLTTEIGAASIQADGGGALSYSVGPSFINWLNAQYGIEGIRAINELWATGIPVREAISEALGVPFMDLENGWRAYLGLEPFTLADLDPVAALVDVEDSLLAVGDTLALPNTKPIVNLLSQPRDNAIGSGSCFAGTDVEVLRIGEDAEGTVWFQIDCLGQVGWVLRDALVSS